MTVEKREHAVSRVMVTLGRLLLTGLIPILLVIASARLLMTPVWLQIEYNRPGFPSDVYGFTSEDRLRYAPVAIDYLLSDAGIHVLGDMRSSEGRPLYTALELQHMHDVKVVTQVAFTFLVIAAPVAALVGWLLWRKPSSRPAFWRALRDAGLITLGAILAIVVGAVLAWNAFFTAFHNLFFAEGTWQFLYSDTLIRLFPEQFWFDSALVIGIMTGLTALLLVALGGRRLSRA